MPAEKRMMQIFISYRRDDSSFAAGRLSDRLSQHFASDRIFMDIDAIELGVDFRSRIDEAISACDVVIALIGRNWLIAKDSDGNRRLDSDDDFVRLELNAALKRGIHVIPALVDGASMPTERQLPEDLRALVRRNGLEIGHSQFQSDVALLIKGLEGIFARKRVEPGPGGTGKSEKDPPPAGPPRWKFVGQAKSIGIVLALAAAIYLVAFAISSSISSSEGQNGYTGFFLLASTVAVGVYLFKLKKKRHFIALTLGAIAVIFFGGLSLLLLFN